MRVPRGAVTRRAAAAGAVLLAASLSPAGAQQSQAGLQAEIRVEPAAAGQPLAGGDFARVTVAYRDAVTGRAPAGLQPAAWVRRVEPGRPPCERAAQNFRITRALSRDDVPLFGAWIAVLNRDGSVALIDPKVDFQGSSTVALRPLGAVPAAWTAFADLAELAVSLPGKGEVVRLALPSLAVLARSRAAARPGALLEGPAGTLYAADDAAGDVVLMDRSGHAVLRRHVGSGGVRLAAVGASARFPPSLVALAGDGAALWLDAAAGETVAAYPEGTFARTGALAGWNGAFAVGEGGGKRLDVRFRDAPGRAFPMPLSLVPDGLAADPRGRFALAWSGAERRADLVELPYGQVVQGFALDAAIGNAAFSGDILFAGHDASGAASILDLKPRRSGVEAMVRAARLESADPSIAPATPPAALPAGTVVRAIGDGGLAVAYRPGSETLFLLSGDGTHPSPIVGTVALRGGTGADVAILDRGMREVASGIFQANVHLPERGPLEIVATTGVGGTTSCRRIDLAGAAQAAEEPRLLRLDAAPVTAGTAASLRLRLAGLGQGIPPPDRLALEAMALAGGGWRQRFEARRHADGTYLAEGLLFPAPGFYPVIPLDSLPDADIAPVMIEVRP